MPSVDKDVVKLELNRILLSNIKKFTNNRHKNEPRNNSAD